MFTKSESNIVNSISFCLDMPIKLHEDSIYVKINHKSSNEIQLIDSRSTRIKCQHIFGLIVIFLLSILSLCLVYVLFPKIDSYVFDELKRKIIHYLFHFHMTSVQTKMDLKFRKQLTMLKFLVIFYTNIVNIIDI